MLVHQLFSFECLLLDSSWCWIRLKWTTTTTAKCRFQRRSIAEKKGSNNLSVFLFLYANSIRKKDRETKTHSKREENSSHNANKMRMLIRSQWWITRFGGLYAEMSVPLYSFAWLFCVFGFWRLLSARTLAVIICHTRMFYTLLDIFSTKGKFAFHTPQIHNSFSSYIYIQFSEWIPIEEKICVFFAFVC